MENRFVLSEGELQIPCIVSAPDSGDVQRLVLGVHGFCGSMADPIQVSLAEEMVLFSSASLRFDFPAHGESPLDTGFFTLENCIRTLTAVARRGKALFPQVEDLCVFATGFGAYVMLLALPQLMELPGRLRLVVQTPSVMMHKTLLSMLGISRETLRSMDTYPIHYTRPLTVTYRFYRELEENSVLAPQPIPMLILHGEKDDFISQENIRGFRALNEDSRLVIIPGASHRFLEEGAWDMVLDLTRDWFEFQQVLLTDWD